MKITTKKGDEGFTELLFGASVDKNHPQIEALGTVDELNAALGMARVCLTGEGAEVIDKIQSWLVTLMGELAMPEGAEEKFEKSGFDRIGTDQASQLVEWGRSFERGKQFSGWERPGQFGGETSARLQVARTIARRAERSAWKVSGSIASQDCRIFLNRLSDLLWIMAAGLQVS